MKLHNIKIMKNLSLIGFILNAGVSIAASPSGCMKIDATKGITGQFNAGESCQLDNDFAIIRLNKGSLFKAFSNQGAKCSVEVKRGNNFDVVRLRFSIGIDDGSNCQLFIKERNGKTGSIGISFIGG